MANIPELTPTEAYAMLQQESSARLVDVRSTMEFDYVGHPEGALHLPLKEPPDWQTRPNFVANLKERLNSENHAVSRLEEMKLLMLCRSGKRSEQAAELLQDAGFEQVYNIVEGFEGDLDSDGHRSTINGWRFHGLPWVQS